MLILIADAASLNNVSICALGREQRAYVVRVVTSNFRINDFSNDIALLQLNRALHLDGEHVAPVCLPEPTEDYGSGEHVRSSGL
jgi:hypothetical protein